MNEPSKITPEWMTLEQSSQYCGLSTRTLETLVKDLQVISSNVRMPGKTRGRRLINRASLDAHIEAGIGGPTELPMNRGRNSHH